MQWNAACNKKNNRESGFNLLELSLVLVVVGLIIAGVFQGASMVERSKLSGIVSDAKGVAEAVAQFQKTYHGLPGDLLNASTLLPGSPAGGNGNGKIESTTGNREDLLFWQHLSASGLLKKEFTPRSLTPTETVMAGSKDNSGFVAGESDNIGVFLALSGVMPSGAPAITDTQLNALYSPTSFAAVKAYPVLSGKEAKDIDTRYDDGNPTSGAIRAQPGLVYSGGAWGLSTCSYTATTDTQDCALVYATENKSAQVQQARSVACGIVGDTRKSSARSCEVNASGTRTGLVGDYIETCNENGAWELSGHTCRSVNCPGGSFAQTRQVACPANYGSGSVTQICDEGGEWLTQNSTCNPASGDACTTAGLQRVKACPINQTGAVYETCNGTSWDVSSNNCVNIACAGGQAVGSHRTGTCPSGFTGNTSETCTANGTWASTYSNNCQPNGTACTTVGATRKINCPTGMSGPDNHADAISQECRLVSGSNLWVTTSNKCVMLKCGDYQVGQSRKADTPCPNHQVGDVMEICTATGNTATWVTSTLNCAAARCIAQSNVGNANWPDTNPGVTATASSCASGYAANGSLPTRACNTDGSWGAVINPCVPGAPSINFSFPDMAYTTWTTGSVPTYVDDGVTITNMTNTNSISVTFQGAYDSANDFLQFVNNDATAYGNITGTYNAGTGVLNLLSAGGTATNAQWQNALRHVSFRNREMPLSCSYRTLRFAAMNAFGSASADINVYALPQEDFSAAWFGTVLAWLDANSGTSTKVSGAQISSWVGRNGYTVNGSGTARPIFSDAAVNGRPVVTFFRTHNLDGATNLGLSGNMAVSDFVVTKSEFTSSSCTTAGGAGCRYPCVYGFYNGAACTAGVACTWIPHIYNNGTTYLYFAGNVAGSGITSPVSGALPAEYYIHSNVKAAGNVGTTLTSRLNGAAMATSLGGPDQAPSFGNAPLSLGQCYISWAGAAKYEGSIAEMIIYGTAIPNSSRDVIESYLAGKWWRDSYYYTALGPVASHMAGVQSITGSPTKLVIYQAPTNWVATPCSPYGSGWQAATNYSSCKAARAAGNTTSGTYTIDPDGPGGNAPFSVYCDMTTSGGGWTVVWVGIGGQNKTSLSTTAAFNTAGATTVSQTFKFDDNTINSLLTEGYMLRSTGLYNNVRYMSSSCEFAAMTATTRAPSPACGVSYTSMAWAGAAGNPFTHTEWTGLSDCNSNACYFLTRQLNATYNTWITGNGVSGVWCNGGQANCNMVMYVR